MADALESIALAGSLGAVEALSGSVAEMTPMAPVDPELDAESQNAVANRAVVEALRLKLDKASSMTNDEILGVFHS